MYTTPKMIKLQFVIALYWSMKFITIYKLLILLILTQL